MASRSDQDAAAVVDLMLDDLGRPAGEGFEPNLEAVILIPHLDGAVSFRLPGPGQGQAPLLRLIGSRALDDLRIEHHGRASVVDFTDDL